MSEKTLILLTNDDGIRSPGLHAAAGALAALGEVIIAAPHEQWSGAGRSLPSRSSGRILAETLSLEGHTLQAYAVEGTPAQAVQHALLELLPRRPDLVVAGINYGENVGSGVTISGTVGATLEGACFGIPGLAVSLQTETHFNLSHSSEMDFSTAAHFTQKFAGWLLALPRLPDVDVLKVEVPESATPATPWRLTRVSRSRYYHPLKPNRVDLTGEGHVGYMRELDSTLYEPDSDVAALLQHVVAVTPLSLDLTSRIDLAELARHLTAQ